MFGFGEKTNSEKILRKKKTKRQTYAVVIKFLDFPTTILARNTRHTRISNVHSGAMLLQGQLSDTYSGCCQTNKIQLKRLKTNTSAHKATTQKPDGLDGSKINIY